MRKSGARPGDDALALTRSELEALAGSQLTVRSAEQLLDGGEPPKLRWRAEFGRS